MNDKRILPCPGVAIVDRALGEVFPAPLLWMGRTLNDGLDEGMRRW